MTDLTLHEATGQLLIGGFPDPVTTPPAFIAEALATGTIGGVILFRRNVQDVEQVCALNQAIHAAAADAPAAPFVCVDQEGGRVVRLRDPLTPIPPMRVVGDAQDARLTASISEVVATEVGALGFNVNFAPVLDVDTNPANPVIGDRAFGADPNHVARHGGAWVAGHTIAGVIPCGKHFPGHGDTDQDSHLTLPAIAHDRARLDAVELLPFRRLVQGADIPMLMTAHIIVHALDPVYPATLSHIIIGDLLRRQMQYDGVIVSDCLEMKAVADHFSIEEMVERGVSAGVDLFLICHTEEKWRRAHAHLMARAERDEAFRARIFESAGRVLKLKREALRRVPRPWTPEEGWRELLGHPDHRATLQRLNSAAPETPLHDPTEAS